MTEPRAICASEFDRRRFLKAAGGLLLALTLETAASEGAHAAGTAVGGYIRIGADETVTVLVGGGEMGQGVFSGLAQGAAEELFVDWSRIQVDSLPANGTTPTWLTGGSSGISRHLAAVRIGAAAAREMLVASASSLWGVAPSACAVKQGAVVNTLTGQSLTYGYLAPYAAKLTPPSNPRLVDSNSFQVIGKPMARLDLPNKVNGRAIYGLDVVLDKMVFAVVKHCPTLGGTVKSLGQKPTGAIAVVPLKDVAGINTNAVAVVASNTWQAMQLAQQLQVSWTTPASAAGVDSALYASQAKALMASGKAYTAEAVGDTTAAFRSAVRTFEFTYSLPYLAHACMEVLNCTVRWTPTSCEIWAPTQAPGLVLKTAMAITGLAAKQITVTPVLMGGGLGRKFEQDYIAQAVQLAMALKQPVKLTWPREEDMQHDQYRPMALSYIKVGLDANNRIVAWYNRVVCPSIAAQRGVNPLPATGDSQGTEGASHRPYGFGTRLVEYVQHPAAVPVGYWRSVGNSINNFAVESALDEIALAIGIDSLTFRQQLLLSSADPLAPRCLAVLNTASQAGQWGYTPPVGHRRGIALSVAFGSIVAEVAEISQPVAGGIKVHSVACAIDCGVAVNPDSVAAQMQGGIMHGLSAALWGEVTFKAGKANVRNWSNYRVLLLHEAPVVTVKVINGDPTTPGGVGEPGVPPIAPAIAGAYARLTGQRIRSLPFFTGGTMHGD